MIKRFIHFFGFHDWEPDARFEQDGPGYRQVCYQCGKERLLIMVKMASPDEITTPESD